MTIEETETTSLPRQHIYRYFCGCWTMTSLALVFGLPAAFPSSSGLSAEAQAILYIAWITAGINSAVSIALGLSPDWGK